MIMAVNLVKRMVTENSRNSTFPRETTTTALN